MIRELALRHIDFSIPYLEQPQSKLDFFKREVIYLGNYLGCLRLKHIL